MRRLMLTLLLLLSALPAFGAGFAEYSGRELFMRFCASCHGAGGQGDGPVADAVAAQVPDLTRLAEREGGQINERQLREIIDGRSVVVAHGTRFMPVWGYEFWVEEGADSEAEREVRVIVDRLIGFLRTIQQ